MGVHPLGLYPNSEKGLVHEFLDAELMALVAKKMEMDESSSLADLMDRLLREYLTSRKNG